METPGAQPVGLIWFSAGVPGQVNGNSGSPTRGLGLVLCPSARTSDLKHPIGLRSLDVKRVEMSAESGEPAPTWVARHQGLLGTVVDLQIEAGSDAEAQQVEAVLVAEMRRLEAVFNGYDPDSELSRWRRQETEPGDELTAVLALAADWWGRSSGAFNPAVGLIHQMWSDSADRGDIPSIDERRQAAGRISQLPYRIEGDRVVATGSLDGFNLNAVAKGWIVDRAVEKALTRLSVVRLTVNAGGDLFHHGAVPLVVGIEDPKRPYDNVPPLLRLALSGGALATSGGSRRGWVVGGRRYSHVLDPRTGDPVDHIASASVTADSVATADAVATMLTVLPVAEGLALVATLDGVGCCLVLPDGEIERNDVWSAAELDA